MKQKKAQWPWHLLSVVVLDGLAGALRYASSLMSYVWRWNRVPQYFAYHAEEAQRAAEYARVDAIAEEGANARVTLVNDAGEVMITRSRLDARVSQLKTFLGELSTNLDRLRHQLRDILGAALSGKEAN